jgi:hypothetical protein
MRRAQSRQSERVMAADEHVCEERKRGSYISVRLPKVLHSFGKVPVRELPSRSLSVVRAKDK